MLSDIYTCKRKVVNSRKNLSRKTKYSSFQKVLIETFRKLNWDFAKVNRAAIDKAVEDSFAGYAKGITLKQEYHDELFRMQALVRRYCAYEHGLRSFDLIESEAKVKVIFAGEEHEVKVDAFVNRGSYYEAIRYRYSAPAFSMKGRMLKTKTDSNPDLALLFLAGKELAKKHNVDLDKTPLQASYFHMKARNDKTHELLLEFNEKDEENICRIFFLDSEVKKIEKIVEDALNANDTCDPSDCEDCIYNDLCNTAFEPHKLEEAEEVEVQGSSEVNPTKQQEEFIKMDSGVGIVNAVAGSGKTFGLMLHTAYVCEQGTDSKNVLLVTFTDKAAAEMKKRLLAYDKGIFASENLNLKDATVETFNSWGQKILDENYLLLGFTSAPTLVDDVIKKDIIIELLDKYRDLPLDYKNAFMSTVAVSGAVVALEKIIDALKAAHAETVDDVHKAVPRYATSVGLSQEYLDIYNEYNSELVKRNMIDYEDQLRLLLKLVNQGVFEKMTYEHVVVDEFQDSNPNQIGIIQELVKRCKSVKSLLVVGDELQAIYGFRNATPENMVNFKDYFPQAVEIKLEDNFRSETPIIAMANRVVGKIAHMQKKIIAHSTATGITPVVKEVNDNAKEASIFVRQAQKLINDGVKPSDIAVLMRTKKELIKIQREFDKAGVPTLLKVPRIVGDEPYPKAIIGLASFLRDNDNMIDLALYAKAMGEDPFDEKVLAETAQGIVESFNNCPNEEAKIALFLALIKDFREDYVGDYFAKELENKGFHTLNEFLNYCIKYRDYGIKETISSSREDADCVNLITVHSAKGLEWDTVLLSIKGFKETSEEERLLYVAVTRAKKRLLVTHKNKQHRLVALLN